MSQRSERITEAIRELEDPLERLSEWYHVPVLAALLTFMLWVRARNWGAFVVDGRVLFSGNDAWYHLRMVQYSVRRWPATMPFDPWTYFPIGTSVGQFGTLYDQLVATVALVVGLGSPTETQVALTLLFAPVVFGTLAAIPTYVLGRRLGGRLGGLVAVLLLALTPGQFLSRSLVGFSDHHIAEVLFMATSVLLVAVAVTVAQRERPVYELVVTREWEALRRPVEWATLAGMVMGLYIWIWPPGVFLVGILGIFFAVTLAAHHARGISPDHVAISGVTTNVVVGILALLPLNVLGFNATRFSLAQPLVAFGVAGGCAFMAAFSRVWDQRDLPRVYYPVGVAAIGIALALAVRLALPETFGFFRSQFMRVFGLGVSATAQTVAEAQPPQQGAIPFLRNSYGLAFFTGLLGYALLAVRVARDDEPRAEHLLVLVWSVFMTLAALTQLRFDYYLAIAVAVLNAFLVGRVAYIVALDEVESPLDVDLYQVMAVLAVLLVVATPLVVTASGGMPAMRVSEGAQPGEVTFWTESLDWLNHNTPAIGAYGDGTPSDLQYYGAYERRDDFRYEDGEYGVMAWWDYGHWITVLGHRIPFANPFQQHAREAANYLLAPNETNANQMLVSEDGERTRYVMVDYQLGIAGTRKFLAPSVWETEHNVSRLELAVPVRNRTTFRPTFSVRRQRSYESMRTRLYVFHGSAATPRLRRGQIIVVDYDIQVVQTPGGGKRAFAVMPKNRTSLIKRVGSMAKAREILERDRKWPSGSSPASLAGTPSSQIGGIAGIPSGRVAALEHYRLVHAGTPITRGPLRTPYPWVKTFERVPGAEIEGSGPPNTTVTASVRLNMTNVGQSFSYRQRVRTGPNGSFTMTLPYATEGYDAWGPAKGYTNTSVRAQGPYRLQTALITNETGSRVQHAATVNVTEAHVIGENESTIHVDLERGLTLPPPGETDGNQSTDNTTGNTTDNTTGNTTDNTTASGTGGGTNTSSNLHPPSSTGYAGPRAAPRS